MTKIKVRIRLKNGKEITQNLHQAKNYIKDFVGGDWDYYIKSNLPSGYNHGDVETWEIL